MNWDLGPFEVQFEMEKTMTRSSLSTNCREDKPITIFYKIVKRNANKGFYVMESTAREHGEVKMAG